MCFLAPAGWGERRGEEGRYMLDGDSVRPSRRWMPLMALQLARAEDSKVIACVSFLLIDVVQLYY